MWRLGPKNLTISAQSRDLSCNQRNPFSLVVLELEGALEMLKRVQVPRTRILHIHGLKYESIAQT